MFDRLSFDGDRAFLQNRTEIYSTAVYIRTTDPGKGDFIPLCQDFV